jgi:hypothetical protein
VMPLYPQKRTRMLFQSVRPAGLVAGSLCQPNAALPAAKGLLIGKARRASREARHVH